MAATVFDFGRHNEAAVRIYLQHWMIKERLGFLLHPSIAIRDDDDFSIMDVACGTGIWLIDLAAQLSPSTRLDGSDSSAAHFPTKTEIPSNVNLSVLDMLQPFPTELHGKYDIVHVARIYMWITNNDPGPLLENLTTLLKPGGYLQWDDLDVGGIYIYKSPPTLASSSCQRWIDVTQNFFRAEGRSSRWLDELPQHYEKHGLQTIDSKRLKIEPGHAKPWTSMQLMAHHDLVETCFIPATAEKDGMLSAAEWRSLVDDVDREAQGGARLLMDLTYTVGRKT